MIVWTINGGVSECAELSPNISTMLPMSRAMSQMWHDMWICQRHSGRSDFLNTSYKYSFVLSSEDEKVIIVNQTNTFVSVDWSIMILDYSWINSFYFKSDCDNKHWQQGGWRVDGTHTPSQEIIICIVWLLVGPAPGGRLRVL